MRTRPAVAVLLLLMAPPSLGDVKLPAIFGDHMVLQRDAKVPIWGWADSGEMVTITAGSAKASATAGDEGKWSATIDGLKASDQPINVTITGKNTVTLQDVLVGDVWVCSGQSNMEFQLGGGKYGFGGALGAAEAIPEADHPTMRLFIVAKRIAFDPQTDCMGSWKVCTPDSAARFSAVGYFFGREIQEDQHVPVGMIGTYWGGTPAESWTSLEALNAVSELEPLARRFENLKRLLPQLKQTYEHEALPKWEQANADWIKNDGPAALAAQQKWIADAAAANAAGEPIPTKPPAAKLQPKKPLAPDEDPNMATVLNNGMVAPIVSFAIKGAIWYQGESNAVRARQYQTLFPTMIDDWRKRWAQGDFPFIWVQLANYMDRKPEPTQTDDGWPRLREAQSMTLKLPNTAQAVIIDIGQGSDIHPKDKEDVGHRLALAARHTAYGEDMVFSGPTYDSMKVEGGKIRVTFKNVGSGLTIAAAPSTQPGTPAVAPSSELHGFTIAGADHQFVWAKATIDGDSIMVSSPDVHHPQAARYGWANNPEANLYNKNGLPASPFRTDGW